MLKLFEKNWKKLLRITIAIMVISLVVSIHSILQGSSHWLLASIGLFISVISAAFSGFIISFPLNKSKAANTHTPIHLLKPGSKQDQFMTIKTDVFYDPENNAQLLARLSLIIPEGNISQQISLGCSILSEFVKEKIFIFFSWQENQLVFNSGFTPFANKGKYKLSKNSAIVGEAYEKLESDLQTDMLTRKGKPGWELPLKRIPEETETLYLPVNFLGDFQGILMSINTEATGFSKTERELLATFADQISLRINNNAVFNQETQLETEDHESQIAQRLKTEILAASPPLINSWDLAQEYAPAKETGGDFFFYFNLPNNALLVMIGKTSGTGLNAVFFLSRLKALISTKVASLTSPAQLFNFLAPLLTSPESGDQFITATAIKISENNSKILVSSAGHATPLINRPNSGYVEIPKIEAGIPLGIFSQGNEIYTDQTIDLLPGDGIFLYTDGLMEFTKNDGQRMGIVDLKLIMDKIPDQPADMLIDSIIKQLKLARDNSLVDEDQTAIYIKME
jgi:serine phosphatase RsbU (regulator of sigma subunit)